MTRPARLRAVRLAAWPPSLEQALTGGGSSGGLNFKLKFRSACSLLGSVVNGGTGSSTLARARGSSPGPNQGHWQLGASRSSVGANVCVRQLSGAVGNRQPHRTQLASLSAQPSQSKRSWIAHAPVAARAHSPDRPKLSLRVRELTCRRPPQRNRTLCCSCSAVCATRWRSGRNTPCSQVG